MVAGPALLLPPEPCGDSGGVLSQPPQATATSAASAVMQTRPRRLPDRKLGDTFCKTTGCVNAHCHGERSITRA